MIADVVVYLSSLNKQTPSRKVDVLMAFAEGARFHGARVMIQPNYDVIPTKLAVILGWPSPLQEGRNIRLRSAVVKEQKRMGMHTMCIDASTFKFHDKDGKYLRYSLNGVFYDTSEYANKNSDATRWMAIANDLGLSIQPWRNSGSHILLLMQRDGGWSMKGLNPVEWTQQKVLEVRKISDLPIVVRPHPGKKIDLSALRNYNVTISDSRVKSLEEDLQNAKAACVFNSSSGVASILRGVPLYVDDRSSVCWEVAHNDIAAINDPTFFERQQWIYDLAAAHWSDDESRQGLVYKKFLPYLN
jgi:hypothetical protein